MSKEIIKLQRQLAEANERWRIRNNDACRLEGELKEARAISMFPSDMQKCIVEVFYMRGDDAFVYGVNGKTSANMIEDIEQEFADNPDEGFDLGDGTYLYTATWQSAQIGDEGRVELRGYWDLTLIEFRPIQTAKEASNG